MMKCRIGGVDRWQMRQIGGSESFNGQSSLRVHFGMGDAVMIDSLMIDWPGSGTEIYTDVEVNRFYLAREGVGLGPVTGVKEGDFWGSIPQGFELFRNYPNPFNPETRIEFSVPNEAFVRLSVYNTLGQEVATLVDEIQSAGYRSVIWGGRNSTGESVASGLYFYRLEAGNIVLTEKMLLLR